MGCTECKKNKTTKEEILKSTEFIQKGVTWFVLIWSVFAIYGIYTFINKFI
jgi:hypothetical protein